MQEMPAHDETFKKIEAYNDMTIQALQYSKIGKGRSARAPVCRVFTDGSAVMKKISTLEGIPRDDELHIRERAAKLMNDVSALALNWRTWADVSVACVHREGAGRRGPGQRRQGVNVGRATWRSASGKQAVLRGRKAKRIGRREATAVTSRCTSALFVKT